MFGLERGYCLMIGGDDEAVARLEPIFDALAPGVDAAPRTPGRTGEPIASRARLPALRPERCRALREDGPQRHRVRDHGRVRRGSRHPRTTPTSACASATRTQRPRRSSIRSSTSTTSTSRRSPSCGGADRWSARGCSTSPRTRSSSHPSWRSSTVACPTRARAAGRCKPRSRSACRRTCSRRRCSTGSRRRATPTIANKLQSAMRKQFGGHIEKIVREEGMQVSERSARGRLAGVEGARGPPRADEATSTFATSSPRTPTAATRFTVGGGDLFLDYSKNRITRRDDGAAARARRSERTSRAHRRDVPRRAHQRHRGPRRAARRAAHATRRARSSSTGRTSSPTSTPCSTR